MRVPVPDGSAVDLVCEVGRDVTVEEVNTAIRERADTGRMRGILAYTEDPIVSVDIIGTTYSSIFDAQLTMTNGSLVKVVSWYDNEYGYSNRLVDLASRVLA
jgi:glyceraldehyde 3-phosphate dehydrogenase